MKYKSPLPGNPNQITIMQHILPKRSIERFSVSSSDIRVQVYSKTQSKQFLASPNNEIFCAKRIWNQGSETGFIKIESDFQILAEAITNGNVHIFNLEHKRIIDDFFALWHLRAQANLNPIQDYQPRGVVGATTILSEDDREKLEIKGIGTIGPGGKFSGRDLTGDGIKLGLIKLRMMLKDTQWGMLKALNGEFIVPDSFFAFNIGLVPLTPTIYLALSGKNIELNEINISEINNLAIERSREYYFARNLSRCPRNLL